ncbi:hypothetical protein [Streptomyces catenulae]|uniref:Uncharacterized protein n=1 Tax=Streptomyces catenulae TaxID=66875 RepID=A0ABV2YTS0_9ACTN|nr:hypothetical protein [Streptomyces catenulae]
MNDEETAARFDGRPSVEFDLGGFSAHHADRITWLATELGYRLSAEERPGRGQYRLRYTRDDSPPARQRAQAALSRVQAAGSWLAVTAAPCAPGAPATPPQPSAPNPVTPLRAARAQRLLTFYEESSPARTPLILLAAATGFALLAVAVRETVPLCATFGLLGAASAVAAALAPRLLRKSYDTQLRLVEEDRRRQAARFPVPPPGPVPPMPDSGASGGRPGV